MLDVRETLTEIIHIKNAVNESVADMLPQIEDMTQEDALRLAVTVGLAAGVALPDDVRARFAPALDMMFGAPLGVGVGEGIAV